MNIPTYFELQRSLLEMYENDSVDYGKRIATAQNDTTEVQIEQNLGNFSHFPVVSGLDSLDSALGRVGMFSLILAVVMVLAILKWGI